MKNNALKVCFVVSEADPLIKIGGLGDVGGTLPAALKALSLDETDGRGIDVRVVIPYHDELKAKNIPSTWVKNFKIPYDNGFQDVYVSTADDTPVPTYLIDGDPVRNKGVYSSDTLADIYKYVFFSSAAIELFKEIDWIPDVVHAHDWHSGASVMKASMLRSYNPDYARMKILYTIHNLPYSGGSHPEVLDKYGLRPSYEYDIPEHLRYTPMALGLSAADKISTVSETYAKEIMTPAFGNGYEHYLRRVSSKVCGIVNGIQPDQWNPALDKVLYANFDKKSIEKRAENKRMLQREVNLPERSDVPLIIMIGRLDVQKGFDIAFDAMRRLRDRDWQCIILGSGNPELQRNCLALAAENPERVRAEIRYDGALSRKMYAGGDMLLMPSRYEPCGIAQMIAMLYGCAPIAHSTGGLRDTIIDPLDSKDFTGYLFADADGNGAAWALSRALDDYNDKQKWFALQQREMCQDFAWHKSALKYFELYKSL